MGNPVNSPFSIEVIDRDGVTIVRVAGELDVASAPVLDETLRQAEAAHAPVIAIDLNGVSFIDSTGLRALLEAQARDTRHPTAGRLRITGGSAQAQKLFRLAGVLDKLPFAGLPEE